MRQPEAFIPSSRCNNLCLQGSSVLTLSSHNPPSESGLSGPLREIQCRYVSGSEGEAVLSHTPRFLPPGLHSSPSTLVLGTTG